MRPELEQTALAGTDEPDTTATAAPRAPSVVTAPDRLAVGQQLGHFRVERLLGAGGMGEVYLATDLALDRPVALKVLPAHLAVDPGRRERMVREARAQARITHPNVGHIYFIGEEQGRLYFAMEYVAGVTLADRVTEGPLPPEEALAIVHAVALGLREAQRAGITHRDVKPSNLMLDAHGGVKVLDFGLAAGEPGAPADGPVAQTSLVGTPLYMAPEQARGEPVDLRADIYALGATLYHLVAGEPPFRAETLDELRTLHASAARPHVPRRGQRRTSIAAIDALCARMMGPLPADRFASYDELIRAIEMASIEHSRPAGFWVRGIAVGFDALVSLIVLTFGLQAVTAITGTVYSMMAPFFTVAAAYSVIGHAVWGRTLGKALFELELVELETGIRPRWRGALVRTTVLLGAPVGLAWIADTIAGPLYDVGEWFEVAIAFWFLLCLVRLGHASARVHGKRTPWDRAAGTMVRYRSAGPRAQRTG